MTQDSHQLNLHFRVCCSLATKSAWIEPDSRQKSSTGPFYVIENDGIDRHRSRNGNNRRMREDVAANWWRSGHLYVLEIRWRQRELEPRHAKIDRNLPD